MGILAALWLLLGVVLPALAAPPQADFYVAPEGNDAWSGLLAAPNARQNDGPFASLQRAQMAVRQLRKRQPDRRTPIRVLLRGGTYSIPQPEAFTRPEPLVFTPEDSGTPDSRSE